MVLPLGRAARRNVNVHFGTMISFKVALYSAVAEDKDSALKTVCTNAHDISKINNISTCPVCKATSGFGKAHENGNALVLVDEETLNAANAADLAFKEDIALTLHPVAEVSNQVQPSGKSYYLNPEGRGGEGMYGVLVEVIRARPDLAFMAQFTLKTAVSTFRLIVAGAGTLVLQQQAEPRLIRELPVVASRPALAAELAVANTLADALVTPFDAAALARPKSTILAQFVDGKDGFVPATAAGEGSGMADLTAMLTAALAKEAPPAAPVKRRRPVRKAS